LAVKELEIYFRKAIVGYLDFGFLHITCIYDNHEESMVYSSHRDTEAILSDLEVVFNSCFIVSIPIRAAI